MSISGATDPMNSSSDMFERIPPGFSPSLPPAQPTPQQLHVTKEKIEQKKAEDQRYASQRYLKLQEDIRLLVRKREEDDRKREAAMDEERHQEDIKKQQLQLTNFPSHHFQTYRAENKVGKAKE